MAEAVGFVEQLSTRLVGAAFVKLTAAFSDGESLYAVRYASDGHAPTLFCRAHGWKGWLLPRLRTLNDEKDTWVEIPSGSAVIVGKDGLDAAAFTPRIERFSQAAE